MKRELRYTIPISDISKDEEPKSDGHIQGRKYKPFRTEYQVQFKQYPLLKEPEFELRTVAASIENQQKDQESKQDNFLCKLNLFSSILNSAFPVRCFLFQLLMSRTIVPVGPSFYGASLVG